MSMLLRGNSGTGQVVSLLMHAASKTQDRKVITGKAALARERFAVEPLTRRRYVTS